MIYERPVFRTLGDTALNLEFGDETSIPLNFRILGVDAAIHQSLPKGIIETNPQVRSLGIIYDPLSVTRNYLIGALSEFIEAGSEVDKLASRRLTIPALYDDVWSSECAESFGVRNNMDFIAEFNEMSVEQVIKAHTSSDYWVTGVGFVPGAFLSYAMNPKLRIGAPLYRTPRTWTHSRLLNFGGTTSTIYPMRVPGGGQLFGRTPLNIFEPEQKNAAFRESPVLAKAGDRHRYIAIVRDEYDDIRAQVEAGAYDYAIEEDTFDCAGYLAWLEEQGEPPQKQDPNATWDETESTIRGPA